MTTDERRIFEETLRGLAATCHVAQFRCELFDDDGNPDDLIAHGVHACIVTSRQRDGRCGPGGAAALLRSMAALAEGETPPVMALRNAARLTFDTDEQFAKMFPTVS